MSHVCELLKPREDCVYAWSDSIITLAWIQTPPQRLKPFVANRVAEIIQQLPPNRWRYVPTSSNPADVSSRGMFPEELIHVELWWKGPPWLMQAPHLWPELQPGKLSTVPELRSTILTITTSTVDFISRYSTYSKLLFVTGWILRFIQNARIRDPNKRELLCHISGKDTQVAEQVLIRMQQDEEFPEEKARVTKGKCVSRFSCLRYLDAILGKDGLLRVGGRLENAPINVDQRNPPWFPPNYQAPDTSSTCHPSPCWSFHTDRNSCC